MNEELEEVRRIISEADSEERGVLRRGRGFNRKRHP